MILSFVLFNTKKRERKTDSNDSRSAVPEMTQMIRAPRSRTAQMTRAPRSRTAQMTRAPRSRTDSNDSRSAVPELTQMIRGPELPHDSRSAVPI